MSVQPLHLVEAKCHYKVPKIPSHVSTIMTSGGGKVSLQSFTRTESYQYAHYIWHGRNATTQFHKDRVMSVQP
jgi:hypothetical protein